MRRLPYPRLIILLTQAVVVLRVFTDLLFYLYFARQLNKITNNSQLSNRIVLDLVQAPISRPTDWQLTKTAESLLPQLARHRHK